MNSTPRNEPQVHEQQNVAVFDNSGEESPIPIMSSRLAQPGRAQIQKPYETPDTTKGTGIDIAGIVWKDWAYVHNVPQCVLTPSTSGVDFREQEKQQDAKSLNPLDVGDVEMKEEKKEKSDYGGGIDGLDGGETVELKEKEDAMVLKLDFEAVMKKRYKKKEEKRRIVENRTEKQEEKLEDKRWEENLDTTGQGLIVGAPLEKTKKNCLEEPRHETDLAAIARWLEMQNSLTTKPVKGLRPAEIHGFIEAEQRDSPTAQAEFGLDIDTVSKTLEQKVMYKEKTARGELTPLRVGELITKLEEVARTRKVTDSESPIFDISNEVPPNSSLNIDGTDVQASNKTSFPSGDHLYDAPPYYAESESDSDSNVEDEDVLTIWGIPASALKIGVNILGHSTWIERRRLQERARFQAGLTQLDKLRQKRDGTELRLDREAILSRRLERMVVEEFKGGDETEVKHGVYGEMLVVC